LEKKVEIKARNCEDNVKANTKQPMRLFQFPKHFTYSQQEEVQITLEITFKVSPASSYIYQLKGQRE